MRDIFTSGHLRKKSPTLGYHQHRKHKKLQQQSVDQPKTPPQLHNSDYTDQVANDPKLD